MKKILHISFAFVFTVLTVGITINKHYSGGELFSYALYGEADSCCDEPCECCDDESNVIQFTADYLFSINQFDHANVIIDLFSDNILDPLSLNDEVSDSGERYLFSDISPPGIKTQLSKIQTFLL